MTKQILEHNFVIGAFAFGMLVAAGCGAAQPAATSEPSPTDRSAAARQLTTAPASGGTPPTTTAASAGASTEAAPDGSASAVSDTPRAGEGAAAPAQAKTDTGSAGAAPASVKGAIRGTITTATPKAAQNAVVYLTDAGSADTAVNATLLGKDMNFVPHVSVMSAGGTLTFVNGEPFPDTAFSPSNEKWDFGMVPVKASRSRKFEKAGVYTVLCRLHPNELGYLIVAPSSYVAKTDKSGAFSIANVPAGKHTIVAWAPKMKVEEREIEVSGEQTTVDFDLKR